MPVPLLPMMEAPSPCRDLRSLLKETLMKSYLRRIIAELARTDVLTHTLPYPARVEARRG